MVSLQPAEGGCHDDFIEVVGGLAGCGYSYCGVFIVLGGGGIGGYGGDDCGEGEGGLCKNGFGDMGEDATVGACYEKILCKGV